MKKILRFLIDYTLFVLGFSAIDGIFCINIKITVQNFLSKTLAIYILRCLTYFKPL